jgi:hypothetical protein
MAIKRFYDDVAPAAETVTDERIRVSTAVVISEVTYYEGWMFGVTDEAIGGTGTTLGAWTAVLKGGTQYEVIFSGLPTTNQVLLDLATGRLLTSASATLYLRYYDYGRLWRFWELGGEMVIPIVGQVDCASETIAYQQTVRFPFRFVRGDAVSECATDAEVQFILYNVTSGDDETITIDNGDAQGEDTWAAGIAFQPGDVLRLSVAANSGGAVNPVIRLRMG